MSAKTCPLFPRLKGIWGITVCPVVGGKRTDDRNIMYSYTTLDAIKLRFGPGRYYLEPHSRDGRVLPGGREIEITGTVRAPAAEPVVAAAPLGFMVRNDRTLAQLVEAADTFGLELHVELRKKT